MPHYDFRAIRLYVDGPLASGNEIAFGRDQTNYLVNVLRFGRGDTVLLFNGRDGEWRASLASSGKRSASALVETRTRPQTQAGELHFLFAPLKHARLDYLVQKAVEMGASRLQPVITRHTQVARVNIDRMRANVIEAAEQCGVLSVPDVGEPAAFEQAIATDRVLIFCDERADIANPVDALVKIPRGSALTVLVGPEGGFADEERAALLALPKVVRIALGPRILRADTAAVAALTLVQAVLGDWHHPA
jgi:16S rRNA (uracil1498-N3)-methyltransferase